MKPALDTLEMEAGPIPPEPICEEMLAWMVAAAPAGLAITDQQQADHPIIFANPAFEAAVGCVPGALPGNSWRHLFGEDQRHAPPKEILAAVGAGHACTVRLRERSKDGSRQYSELSLVPLRNAAQRVTHLVWQRTDMTATLERKERLAISLAEKEDRFRAYVDNANEAVWRIDFEPSIPLDAPVSEQVQAIFDSGIFSEANDVAAQVYGFSKGTEVTGRPLREFMRQSNPDNVEMMQLYVSKRFHIRDLLTYEEALDGTTRTIVNNITPSIEAGRVTGIWGASHDLTELFSAQHALSQSEQALAAQKEALEQKNLALKELIAHIELDKKAFKDQILANIEQVLLPIVEKLRCGDEKDGQVEQLRRGLEDLTSSFGRKMADQRLRLTPREIEVCNLVRNGLSSKEIADLLNIALNTVEKHRRMARNKLGLANKGMNLRSYLNSLE